MRRAAALLAAVGAMLLAPTVALAHPLGNFTINHYAGIRVSPTEIRLDVVLDRAEIPTFQERLRLDADENGEVSDAEAAAAQEPECRTLATSLVLTVDGAALSPELMAAGLSFPPGAGGLSTMRLVCEFVALLEGGVENGRSVAFADRSFSGRLGWREIVVAGDRVTVSGSDLSNESVSSRLTSYPEARLQAPLAIDQVEFRVAPGGLPLEPFSAPEVQSLDGAAPPSEAAVPSRVAPGGIATEIPSVFQAADLSPGVLLGALITALVLGAGHALTPGHGKTLMAAYLVGTRGTALHAAGLGLSVTVSHTLGILVLASLVLVAGAALPADAVVRWLPAVAALTIVAIGTWMLVGELRRRRSRAARERVHAAAHARGEAHEHPHEHSRDDAQALVHSHGGVPHTHLPEPGSTITWRSLFALGLAGGIVPSTSALVILLGTIAAGRPAFGLVLVVAFGLGMALVMSGIGLALVVARDRLGRLSAGTRIARLSAWAPLAAACLVLALGVWLTGQAILGQPTF